MRQTWLDQPDDMQWLQDVHGAPADMHCAVVRGNEDSPERIEAWREPNPHHAASPDWVYVSPTPNRYYSDSAGNPVR